MDSSLLFMWAGFILASYSVMGNDVIQALGTFLTSNERRVPWYILWFFGAGIMSIILILGYSGLGVWLGGDDVAFDRLDKFIIPERYEWYFLIPPIVLLLITRIGIPVSTTFMILTFFSINEIPGNINEMLANVFDFNTKLGGMIQKSIVGYLVAFVTAAVIYVITTRLFERYFIKNPLTEDKTSIWVPIQWLSTGFLWSQWLTQDLANIYVYLDSGQNLSLTAFVFSLLVLVGLLGYIFWLRGGRIQEVVRRKVNTADIRSATIIDFIYGIILFVFKDNYLGLFEGKLPMSTTWVFIGLLAGRELAMRWQLNGKLQKEEIKDVSFDLLKIIIGLVISVVIVFAIRLLVG